LQQTVLPTVNMTTPPPRPEPPLPPEDGVCCHSGCNPCVWDFYDAEMAAYRNALAQWEAAYGVNGNPAPDQHQNEKE
jgi:hypothetical protein